MDYEATAPFILLDIAAQPGRWTYPFFNVTMFTAQKILLILFIGNCVKSWP